MKTLDLYRLWEVMNKVIEIQHELYEEDIYVQFFGNLSKFYGDYFEDFLEKYSFRLEKDFILVFNNDKIPYEDFTFDDFNEVPFSLLSVSDEELDDWIKSEIDAYLLKVKSDKAREKEYLKTQIKLLNEKLKTL